MTDHDTNTIERFNSLCETVVRRFELLWQVLKYAGKLDSKRFFHCNREDIPPELRAEWDSLEERAAEEILEILPGLSDRLRDEIKSDDLREDLRSQMRLMLNAFPPKANYIEDVMKDIERGEINPNRIYPDYSRFCDQAKFAIAASVALGKGKNFNAINNAFFRYHEEKHRKLYRPGIPLTRPRLENIDLFADGDRSCLSAKEPRLKDSDCLPGCTCKKPGNYHSYKGFSKGFLEAFLSEFEEEAIKQRGPKTEGAIVRIYNDLVGNYNPIRTYVESGHAKGEMDEAEEQVLDRLRKLAVSLEEDDRLAVKYLKSELRE
jgi:hypothetical protein